MESTGNCYNSLINIDNDNVNPTTSYSHTGSNANQYNPTTSQILNNDQHIFKNTNADKYVKYLNSVPIKKFNKSKKLTELEKGKYYRVRAFKVVNGKFGRTVVVSLFDEDDISKTMFDVFLPKRYDYIESNNNVRNVVMAYYGKKFIGEGFEKHTIEFTPYPERFRNSN